MALKLPKTLREWAIAILVAIWGLFGAAIGAPWVTALAAQAGLFTNPVGQVTTILGWVVHLTAHLWFGWAAGALLAGSAGFAGGVWLDGLVRKRSAEAPVVGPELEDTNRLHSRIAELETANSAFAVELAEAKKPVPAPPGVVTLNIADISRAADTVLAKRRAQIIKDWTRPSSMQMFQAACLWVEELPPALSILPISDSARASLEMLKGAAIGGEIPPSEIVKEYQSLPPDAGARLTRKGLVAFALARKEYPLFLFPDGPASDLVNLPVGGPSPPLP